jgi:FtsZ-interacting cell division protein ZipA
MARTFRKALLVVLAGFAALPAGKRAAVNTTWIIVIVVAAVALLAIALGVAGRRSRLAKRHEQASELREQAQARARSAKQAELAAEEQAERAKRERAAAEEHAARAREVDPDVDDSDREREDTAAR